MSGNEADEKRKKDGATLINALKEMEARWPATLEMLDYTGKLIRARYEIAIDKGFTEQQALELCVKNWNL